MDTGAETTILQSKEFNKLAKKANIIAICW